MKPIQLTLFFFLLTISSVFAQDYSMPEVNIRATIQEDGNVLIEERRTYNYNGSFSWADYRLPKQGFTEIRNIRVSEADTDYINENSEEPGTFTVSESDEIIEIKWHYSAENEERTFILTYELANAVSIGPEYSEFFWTFVGEGRSKVIGSSEITVQLPNQVDSDSLHSWNYSSAPDSEEIKSESAFTLTSGRVNRNQNLAIRALFPTSVFQENLIEISDPNLDLDEIIQEEAEYDAMLQEQAERDEFFAEISLPISILLSVLSLGIFYFLYQKYGKRHSTNTISNRETVVIPDKTPPAIIGRLMSSRHSTSQHLVATLFDLARRGWFNIEEKEKESSFWSSGNSEFVISLSSEQPDEHLPKWEKMIVDFTTKRVKSGKNTFDKLFQSSGSKVAKWFSLWKKEVKNVFDEKEWIDQKSYTGVWANVAAQFVIDVAAIVLFIMGGPTAFIALFTSFIFMFASAVIIRRTKNGEETYQRWKTYRDGLKNADERTLRMEILDLHFIYATALHLSKKELNTLIESSYDSNNNRHFPWIVLMSGSSHTPATVASSISTLAATSSASFTGTTGGSGASTGSAGGGATGGAG
ncbi:MAG: DUF2207 domain-containing protein [Rhodohalobacter sp.]|uniref:DUF2207 family protein n=2 Tax=Rhodohalobacter sp. TaxID=1974210 RepID=UPI003976F9E9